MRMHLLAGASIMALHCSISSDAPEGGAPPGATPTPATEGPVEKAFDDFKEEIAADLGVAETAVVNEVASLINKAREGYDWCVSELKKLEPTVAADFDAAVSSAIKELQAGETEGAVVADVLAILARDGMDILSKVGSDLAETYVALVMP